MGDAFETMKAALVGFAMVAIVLGFVLLAIAAVLILDVVALVAFPFLVVAAVRERRRRAFRLVN